MDIIFFGIQGSGKGTQAKRLAHEFGFEIFEAGAELRAIAASGSELGTTVKSYIDQGHLVPHEIIMKVVREAILKRPAHQKILFDGIPRDLDQMRDFDAIMAEAGRDFWCVNFDLSEEEAHHRILHRAQVEGRIDDANAEIVERRMKLFFQKTVPVIEAYQEKGIVTDLDASGQIESVYEELKQVIIG